MSEFRVISRFWEPTAETGNVCDGISPLNVLFSGV